MANQMKCLVCGKKARYLSKQQSCKVFSMGRADKIKTPIDGKAFCSNWCKREDYIKMNMDFLNRNILFCKVLNKVSFKNMKILSICMLYILNNLKSKNYEKAYTMYESKKSKMMEWAEEINETGITDEDGKDISNEFYYILMNKLVMIGSFIKDTSID